MVSRYLSSLSQEEYKNLQLRLWEAQKKKCFICEETIDLNLQPLAIDHIEPSSWGGKDHPDNFALTHFTCNSTKQAANLEVARVLARFNKIKERCRQEDARPNRPNLNDVITLYGGAKFNLSLLVENNKVKYSFPEINDINIWETPLYEDKLSKFKYFFCELPIEYIFHDNTINPRAIGGHLNKLVEEFYRGRPQLHVGLAWTQVKKGSNKCEIRVFDGQHKAAALVLLGVRKIPLRVFINPNIEVLLTANTNAGTFLSQVAFGKSVQRYLGSTLYQQRIARYQNARGFDKDNYNFSEKDLVDFFRGEAREIRRYILDEVRSSITHHPENKLRDYIDLGGRKKERPLSYSTIEKTYYSLFICQKILETPLDYRLDEGENPRILEKEQIVNLMNIIADTIYIDKFDPDIGTNRIEQRLQRGETIPEAHLRAFRMSKEEVLYNWLKVIKKVIERYFLTLNILVDDDALFQNKFPTTLWQNISRAVKNLSKLPLWFNHELSNTAFGGKQTYDFWQRVFQTGKTPYGERIMQDGLDLDELLKE
jgi:hypothetical protein